MSTLLSGYGYHLIARLGNAADIPVLKPGELGYDVDKKVMRVGDDTPTPPRIPSDKALGNFNMSTSGTWTFSAIAMVSGGTVDGVDISKLNAANGFLVRKANNDYTNVSLTSGDGSLQITNGSGVAGNVDLRIHPDILALINSGGYLTSVAVSSIMTGNGLVTNPLSVKASSTTQVGVTRFATAIELGAGTSAEIAVTPSALANLDAGSTLAAYLREIFQTNFTLTIDGTLSGAGNSGSPLSVVQATETQRGSAEIATQTEVDNGTSTNTFISPAKLKGLTAGSPTALALKAALGVGSTITLGDIRMTGPGVVGRGDNTANQPPQVLPFATRAKISAGNAANNNDVANQSTMREYFPLNVVKTGVFATGALPAPATVGKGSVAYDDNRGGIVVSNGTVWSEPRYNTEGLYTTILTVAMTQNTVYTLSLDPKRRYVIGSVNSQMLTGVNIQANISGNWAATSIVQSPMGYYMWWSVPSPDINGTSYLIYPPKFGAFCASSSGRLLRFDLPSLGHTMVSAVTDLGNWNGQIRWLPSGGVEGSINLYHLEPYNG